MPKVRLADGTVVEVGADALFNDDDTPFAGLAASATGPTFTAADIEKARQEEKDKLYGRIESNNEELKALRDQVGSLTAAEQRREAQLQEEQQRLEAEARAKEAEELDAKTLLQRREQEFNERIQSLETDWSSKFEQERQAREAEAALRAKEREFNDLREYAQAQVAAHTDKIAPQLIGWIQGNSKEEIDAAVARAVETTDAIAADFQSMVGEQQVLIPGQQQAVPTPLPGTRAVAGPANIDPAGQVTQTLTPEQIQHMPMDQYAALRSRLNIGGSNGNNQGLFG